MVQALQRVHTDRANPQEFLADDFEQKTVVADEFRDVAFVQGDSTNAYGAGFGEKNAQVNSDGWSDVDLVASGNGAGSAGEDIKGKMRFVVYRDSNREDMIAKSGTYSLGGLRSAVSADRTDKVLIPGRLSQVAGDDSYLAIQVKTNADTDGYEIDPSASTEDLGIARSEIPL